MFFGAWFEIKLAIVTAKQVNATFSNYFILDFFPASIYTTR